jgi:hypothetical protein
MSNMGSRSGAINPTFNSCEKHKLLANNKDKSQKLTALSNFIFYAFFAMQGK